MKFTEDQLKSYAAPLSATEDTMCKRAIEMVRDALKPFGFSDNYRDIQKAVEDTYSYSLEMSNFRTSRKVTIFVQGSYANNTNVRQESDVDVAIVQEDVFKTQYRTGMSDNNYGFVDSPPTQKSFKDEIQEALVYKFGGDVERKNKSIKVHGNTYRKDADTVPSIRYRNYSEDYNSDPNNYKGGISILADDGQVIVNYPELHIRNGKEKNNNTNRYFKKMVRIMKKLRYIMKDNNYSIADRVSSFGLESMIWNIPDDVFKKYSIYRYAFGEIVDYLYRNKSVITYYKEANGIKYLCPSQSDTQNYIGFVDTLHDFYEYDV